MSTSLHRSDLSSFYYTSEDSGGRTVDIDAETADRWGKAMAAFEVVQDEMEAAYAAAVARDTAAAEVRKAEQAVADAQARLEQIRYEQENPPEDPESWPVCRPVGHPDPRHCRGRQYDTVEAAWEGRVVVYDTVARRGGRMSFDVAPFVCVDDHWHLGRVTR